MNEALLQNRRILLVYTENTLKVRYFTSPSYKTRKPYKEQSISLQCRVNSQVTYRPQYRQVFRHFPTKSTLKSTHICQYYASLNMTHDKKCYGLMERIFQQHPSLHMEQRSIYGQVHGEYRNFAQSTVTMQVIFE